MKLNELNKIEEGIISGIKGLMSGQGSYQTKVQDIFIKDFIQDAMTSLNNGLNGGLINANIKTPGTQPAASAQPAAGTQPAAGAQQAGAAPAAKPGQQYYGKIAPNAGPATKPPAPASPFSTPTLNQPKTTVSTTASSAGKPGGITSGGAGIKIKESSYDKMNRVFENIINIDEDDNQMTISDYMMNWFAQYMQGVQWEGRKPLIKQKLEQLQKDYPKNVKQHLTDLAKIGLALSKAGIPAGAPQEYVQTVKQNAADAGTAFTQVKAELDQLASAHPDLYNKFIKTLQPAKAAQPGASAGLVAEGKRKK